MVKYRLTKYLTASDFDYFGSDRHHFGHIIQKKKWKVVNSITELTKPCLFLKENTELRKTHVKFIQKKTGRNFKMAEQ